MLKDVAMQDEVVVVMAEDVAQDAEDIALLLLICKAILHTLKAISSRTCSSTTSSEMIITTTAVAVPMVLTCPMTILARHARILAQAITSLPQGTTVW